MNPRRRWTKDPRAFQRVLNRLEPFTPDELLRLELPIRMSFAALREGNGTEQDFHDVVAALNATLVRSETIDPLCVATASQAINAMRRTWERHQRTGRWGFDGPALAEVEAGIDLHEQLIRLSTPGQMLAAMKTVVERGVKT